MATSQGETQLPTPRTAPRLIVAGSRALVDELGPSLGTHDGAEVVERSLEFSPFIRDSVDVIISGANASSPDRWGEAWAQCSAGVDLEQHPANWNRYGKQAGPRRNKQMAETADALLAFWDGESAGTQDMIRKARERGLDVQIVRLDRPSLRKTLLRGLLG